MANRNMSCVGFLVETIKTQFLGFLRVLDFWLERRRQSQDLGLFSFPLLLINNCFLFLYFSRMILYLSLIDCACDNTPIRG